MSRMDFIDIELERLKAEGLFNQIRTIGSAQGAWIVIDGQKVLNLCSNNYPGLANDPRLKKKAAEALECWGVGPGAVRALGFARGGLSAPGGGLRRRGGRGCCGIRSRRFATPRPDHAPPADPANLRRRRPAGGAGGDTPLGTDPEGGRGPC